MKTGFPSIQQHWFIIDLESIWQWSRTTYSNDLSEFHSWFLVSAFYMFRYLDLKTDDAAKVSELIGIFGKVDSQDLPCIWLRHVCQEATFLRLIRIRFLLSKMWKSIWSIKMLWYRSHVTVFFTVQNFSVRSTYSLGYKEPQHRLKNLDKT